MDLINARKVKRITIEQLVLYVGGCILTIPMWRLAKRYHGHNVCWKL